MHDYYLNTPLLLTLLVFLLICCLIIIIFSCLRRCSWREKRQNRVMQQPQPTFMVNPIRIKTEKVARLI